MTKINLSPLCPRAATRRSYIAWFTRHRERQEKENHKARKERE